jgi:hypothetical protein
MWFCNPIREKKEKKMNTNKMGGVCSFVLAAWLVILGTTIDVGTWVFH